MIDIEKLQAFEGGSRSAFDKDCDVLEYLFDNCNITVPTDTRFFVKTDANEVLAKIYKARAEVFSDSINTEEVKNGEEAKAYIGSYDFSHTSADFESVMKFGIFGLCERIKKYKKSCRNDERKANFYNGLERIYIAALRFMHRAADAANSAGKTEMASGIYALCEHEPKTLFEAMQLSIIYYALQHTFEGTCLRTLGRIDSLFEPFCKNETEDNIRALLVDYLKEIDKLEAPSNIPFALGGTNTDGACLANELSFLILEAYENTETSNTKLHLLCTDHTPQKLIKKALECIQKGKNSIVFMSDKKIIEALIKLGATHEDAVRYHVVGCYECGAYGELTCSCNAKVNIVKALEYALNRGEDMITHKQVGLYHNNSFTNFSDLYTEFERQLVHLCERAMYVTDRWEAHYSEIHSAPILSGTYSSTLEIGGDLYGDHTAKYNNSSVDAVGLATAVDSLAAIKKLVYDEKKLSLNALTEILRNDWADSEALRLMIKNRYPKFGQGNEAVDSIAAKTVKKLASAVNGRSNVKGGVYRLGLFSIDWRWWIGEMTAASADGRKARETISQNTSASFGADKLGATAHLRSVLAIDASDTPNGAVVDIDLHSSAVSGENGLKALYSALMTYIELGGFAVQFNVLDTDILEAAKAFPEKYPSLQVRLCGWNVLFSTLSDKEKEEFIARSRR